MTYADSSPQLLGTSRNAGNADATPVPDFPAYPAILRVWGTTQDDVERAEDKARSCASSRLWDIVEVIPTAGGRCPIPYRDPTALAQDAYYGWAWAAYRPTDTVVRDR